MLKPPPSDTLQGINLSHLGKFGKSSSNYLPRREGDVSFPGGYIWKISSFPQESLLGVLHFAK